MSWAALATQNVPAKEAASLMNCDIRQAMRRLDEARSTQARHSTREQDAAVALLTHSGCAKPVMGRGCWTDIVLGLKRPV